MTKTQLQRVGQNKLPKWANPACQSQMEGKDAGITANAILPGIMDTPANRSGFPSADRSRWVQPGNVASLALWLASDAASQVSGDLIPMYGAGL